MTGGWSIRRIVLTVTAAVLALLVIAAFYWREDILRTALDPKIPYQTYQPPKPPDYASPRAWVLRPTGVRPSDPPADVFFVHPTTYDGGPHWNAPLRQERADRTLHRVMLPNYAGPFVRVGRVFAPRYRQASLYSLLTLREDAREARAFAYRDVEAAFRWYLAHDNGGRPIVLVGVEQGGTLVERLAREAAADPAVKARLAAVYVIDAYVPADRHGPQSPVPACTRRAEPGCMVAWIEPRDRNVAAARPVTWTDNGRLEPPGDRKALCVNPLWGALTDAEAPARLNGGAVNATGVEWGARPAFLTRQVSAQCVNGVLVTSRPKSASLKPSGSWADRRKAKSYNLFYGDLEVDAQARVAALQAAKP
jgi:hypothetical protein